MAIRQAVPAMRGVNYFVPNMSYAQDVGLDGLCRTDLGAPIALNATGILSAQSIATAGAQASFAATYRNIIQAGLAKYGRNLTVVASGAATSNVTVYGYDYLGQPMSESFTLNGTTPVAGKKAFKWITNVTFGATAATTINVGWGDLLGLPYRSTTTALIGELTAGAAPTAGTLLAGASATAAQTATSADPRGTFAPNQATNGTKTYEFTYNVDVVNGLHGARQFYS